MSETNTVGSGEISFCGLLAIVFITLKLAQIGPVAAWSWWWVLSPLWIPLALVILVVLAIVAVVLSIYCR